MTPSIEKTPIGMQYVIPRRGAGRKGVPFVHLIMTAIMLWLAMPRPGMAEELRPRLDDLVAHFTQVVFGAEYAALTTQPQVISKWAGPVVGIHVQGRASPQRIGLANKHVRTLALLTGLQFRTLRPGETIPSIDLVFLKRAEMGRISGPNVDPAVIHSMASDPTMVCYFLTWHSPPPRIVKAMVVVNIEADPVRIDACLLEELTQVMGLPNDVNAYWRSMFNPNDSSTVHSPWDALYIKTLYDPRLKPGMTPAEAAAVVRPMFAAALSNTP